MDIDKLLTSSFAYAKDGLFEKPTTWILLIILALIPAIPIIIVILMNLPLLLSKTVPVIPDIPLLIGEFAVAVVAAVLLSSFVTGYQVRVLRGETPLPRVDNFGQLLVEGIKLIVIHIIYMIPVIIILGLTIGAAVISTFSKHPPVQALLPMLGGVILGLLLALIVGIMLALFAVIGAVRYSRTRKLGEAFNFEEILARIRRIGWGDYIGALIVILVVVVVVEVIIGIIPFVGAIINLIIAPFIMIFYSRYLALLYNSGDEPAIPAGAGPAASEGSSQ